MKFNNVRIAFLLLLLFIPVASNCQDKPIIVTAQDYRGAGVDIIAQNTTNCPYTILLTCDLVNMNSSAPLPFRQVLLASQKKIKLTHLAPIPGQGYRYEFHYQYFLGNTTSPVTPSDQPYGLPYESGKEFRVMQGYNGSFSHLNKQAIDFQMPENSVVCAARTGIVAAVKQDSNTGCAKAACKDQGNYILVFHEDGSYATYVHFRQNGSLVQPGQRVAQGEPIGYSGNTGWTSGPHLHFEVDVPGEPEKTSIPVKFSVAGQPAVELQQGEMYKR